MGPKRGRLAVTETGPGRVLAARRLSAGEERVWGRRWERWGGGQDGAGEGVASGDGDGAGEGVSRRRGCRPVGWGSGAGDGGPRGEWGREGAAGGDGDGVGMGVGQWRRSRGGDSRWPGEMGLGRGWLQGGRKGREKGGGEGGEDGGG
uniref:Glycine-rich cell wall structural protein 1.0-like n=1 Tax=Elaeis guineensis var. tenera TaxID=51953 RepID=A0A6I9S843_ELAGV|nr:glycine-rich cell wall structural protein 1.0-like [Elaeis guineensis]